MDKQTTEDRYKIPSNQRWSTSDEINHLERLGSHRTNHPGDRNRLLREYKQAAIKRVEWGAILKEDIFDYLGIKRKE